MDRILVLLLGLNMPRFFPNRLGEQKSAANLKLIYFSSKRYRSDIIFAVEPLDSTVENVTKMLQWLRDLHTFIIVA